MERIACKECTSPYCHGCNMYCLEQMLMSGKLDALMNENRAIKMDADVRPVVQGFWVEENGEDAHTGELWCIWKCSECGARRTAGWRHTQDGRKPRDNFCPNCGAWMEES